MLRFDVQAEHIARRRYVGDDGPRPSLTS